MPPIREYRDLCDGVCLAFLISYYCPRIVPWTSVRVNHLPTVEVRVENPCSTPNKQVLITCTCPPPQDSIHNILLVSNFSQKHLPYTVFHMTPSDITYMRGAMKQNLVVLLADLFNLFEIHPTKCVNYPGMEQQVAGKSAHDVYSANLSRPRPRLVPPPFHTSVAKVADKLLVFYYWFYWACAYANNCSVSNTYIDRRAIHDHTVHIYMIIHFLSFVASCVQLSI